MKILFLGDFYFDYDYIPDDLLKISEYIKKNNLITILNLEGTIKSNTPLKKGTCLSFSEKYLEALKLLNVKAVNLANNHVMDYGEKGLNELIKQLKSANIGYFGAGINLEEASNPYILNYKDKQIALIGMGWNMEECINARSNSYGTCPLDFNVLNNAINKLNTDVFIPILHMGYEYENLPQPLHLKECRNLLKNQKVKLIIGHHPHVVQAYEQRIFYSLGNFYFGSRRKKFFEDSIIDEPNYGMGIIYNLQKDTIDFLSFVYDGNSTVIEKQITSKNFIDISDISDYDKYFYKNNNFRNRKYVYKCGLLNEMFFNKIKYFFRNSYKFYLRNIKWPIIKKIKFLIKRK